MNKHKHNSYGDFFTISLIFLFFGWLPLTSYTQNCTFNDPQKQREYEVMQDWYQVNASLLNMSPNWRQFAEGVFCDVCELAAVDCDSSGYVSRYVNISFANTTVEQFIPENIGDLVHLKILDLAVDRISSLPESIGNLSKLELLSLGGNNIATLPESIGDLKSLERILLARNQLSSLPNSFGNLTSLKIVNLESNYLTSLPVSFSQLVNLTSLNLIRNNITCFPIEIAALCETPVQVFLSSNPIGVPFKREEAFPGTGVFIEGYCNNPEAYNCSVESTANCSALIFTSSNEQITISNLTPQSTIEIIGRNTNWQIVPICDGDCSETQTITDLMAGEYTVKVQLFGQDGTYCYREEKVNVSSDGGGNTGGKANCNNLIFTGENEQITIDGLTATYNKVEIIGRNTDWQIITICDGNCSDTQTIPDLMAGEYAVKINQSGNDGSYCYREEKITVSDGGGSNSGSSANCDDLSFTTEDGQIVVGGLTASYDKVEIIGRNTNYQIVTICDGNCADTQTIPELSNGEYAVKVNQGGNDGTYCYREEKVVVTNSSSNRNSTIDYSNELVLYPNPVRDRINLKFHRLAEKEGTILIYNAFGQMIQSFQKTQFTNDAVSIDLGGYENGMYLLSVKAKGLPMITKRFVMEHLK